MSCHVMSCQRIVVVTFFFFFFQVDGFLIFFMSFFVDMEDLRLEIKFLP